MDQQLANINLKASGAINTDDTEFDHDVIISRSGNENIHLLSCIKTLDGITTSSIGFDQISRTHIELVKQIQKDLSLLSHVADITKVNSEIDEILNKDVFPSISARYKKVLEDIVNIMTKQQQLTLQICLKQKLKQDENIDELNSIESFDETLSDDKQESNDTEQKLEQTKFEVQQTTSFAIRSLTSLLLILIKSVEQNNPIFVEELLTLTTQLCDQIPMSCFKAFESPSIIDNYWFESLQPLISYINELSLLENVIMANKAMKILLSLSIAKASFKDILPILEKFVFNQVDIYNVRRLFIRLNNNLTKVLNKMGMTKQDTTSNETTDEILSTSLDYLKTIGAFPNSRLIQLNEGEFTGPYIASVILTHIDFYNRIHSIEQFEQGSIDSSISFEFHPNTFEQLFHIIEQLTTTNIKDSNIVIVHILTICLRLFTTHLKFLSTATPTLNRDLLLISDEWRKIVQSSSIESKRDIDLTKFGNDNKFKLWFDLLLKLTYNDNDTLEKTIICQEASKSLIYIIEKKVSSFTEKLSFFHAYIIENKHPLLIEQLLVELKNNVILLSWIEVLLNDNDENKPEKTILYSFIDICFNVSNDIDSKRKEQIKEVLLLFQELLFLRLISPSRLEKIQNNDNNTTKNELSESSVSYISTSFITNYCTHILNISTDNDFLNSLFIGLCSMTTTENFFNFARIQPIFTSILPILVEYLLKNTIYVKNNLYSICWLIGKMSHIMIIGPEQNLLEIKYIDKLKSPLFTGGCEKNKYLLDLYESNLGIYSQIKSNDQVQDLSLIDKEFLMSIYNNIDPGVQVINKMKRYIQDKQPLLKSIEEQANNACAALFAVYIKHYRRINLAKKELFRMNDEKPHEKLLLIYEYANDVKILFATTKAQGGNTTELYEQIRMNSLYLIVNIKETNLIPIIQEEEEDEDLSLLTNTQSKRRPSLQRQISFQRQTSFQRQNSYQPQTPLQGKISFYRQVSRWKKAKYVLRLLRNILQACIRFKKLILAKKQIKQEHTIEDNLNRLIDAFVYGDFYKMTIPITIEQSQFELDEFFQCMSRNYERAMIRLITYKFSLKFIENLLKIDDKNQIVLILNLYLPHLRNTDLEWSYLENIQTTNNQVKEQISLTYYSIIKTIFSFILQLVTLKPKLLVQNIFNLLNLSYESMDIVHLNQNQLIETVFLSFISCIKQSNHIISLDNKLTAYNWFRFYIFKLCENIELNETNGTSNKILKESLPIDTEKEIDNSVEVINFSLNHGAVNWFLRAVGTDTSMDSNKLVSTLDIELYTNQFLILLFRCIYLYDNVRLICANMDYIEELLYIYRNSQNHITILFVLKILRHLISLLPETTDEIVNTTIKNLLNEFLISIDTNNNMTSEIITELINIYRTIISSKSSWQIIAIELLLNNILSCVDEIKLKSSKIIDTIPMNHVFASLSVLGGNIPLYCLGSIVNVYPNEDNNEFDLALIIDVKTNDQISNSSDDLPYCVQYLESDKIEWIEAEKLRIQIDILPTDTFISTDIYESNTIIHTLFDALGYIIQIDTSTIESLTLLELKRRSMSAIDYLLNDKRLVEIFMEKSYTSIIAKLSMSDCLFTKYVSSVDLHLFNQKHLEQYCLSLDHFRRSEQILEIENDHNTSCNINENSQITTVMQNFDDTSFIIWNHNEFNQNPLIANALSMSVSKYHGWKPYMSKSEIKPFEYGRIGNKDISIISMPSDYIDAGLITECGDKHRFKGKISLTTLNLLGMFPTFIIDDVQFTAGKWYYCVRLLTAGVVQIGWATAGFSAIPSNGHGVGDDKYSWSYDGSRATLFNDTEFKLSSEEFRWKKDDICGCGIEIDGENTRIKYWLNGKFLGTLFEHQSNIGTSNTKCNMLPHGYPTFYVPAVSFDIPFLGLGAIEFIFSPEDMTRCPLPNGYKPLLMPKIIDMENSIVPYPYSAYLISDDTQNYSHIRRNTTSTTILYDLVNENHLETSYTLDGYQLLLSKDSNGFPLPIVTHQSSLTISFDFEILNQTSNEQFDIQLFTLNTTEIFSIQLPLNKINNPIQIAIVICLEEQKIKIYFNNFCQIIDSDSEIQTMKKFNIDLLPNIDVKINNLAIWMYALSEEYIRRLFTYNLSYVAIDYKQLKEYQQQQANIFHFHKNQKYFENDFLLPFNEPFEGTLWEKKKKEIDMNESKYFKTIDETNESTIQLFGTKTYLVLQKSIEQWSEYTLILDISIPDLPANNECLTIFSVNKESRICIIHSGKICVFNDEKVNKSNIKIKLNEYMRLLINVGKNFVEVYSNGILQVRLNIDNDKFVTNYSKISSTLNSIEDDVLRIECKSITFLNRSIDSDLINEQMKSTDYSLGTLAAPPFSMIATSLIAIGYKEEWIKLSMKEYNTSNIQFIDTIIRETNEKFSKFDNENQQKRNLIILSRINSSIESDQWLSLGNISKLDNDKEIMPISQFVCDYENSIQTTSIENNDNNESDENEESQRSDNKEWYQQTVYGLDISKNLFEWINDKSLKQNSDEIYQLLDLDKSEQQFTNEIFDQQKRIPKSISYSHKDLSQKQYFDSRFICEHRLISIYARNTILNMLKVWSDNYSSLFPLEKLGDYTFIVKLLRLLDYHDTYKTNSIDENTDRITSLIHSILQFETKELLEEIFIQKDLTIKILQNKAPLLYELQKDIITQMIQFVLKPSLLSDELHEEEEESMIIKQPNLNFIFKMLNLFVKLVTDKSMEQNEIDSFLPLIFRVSFINLIFDLFLLLRNYQSKVFILRLFATLLRASKTINLSIRSQKFLFHLMIELSPSTTSINSSTIRTLHNVVMDLAFLFLQRQCSQDIVTLEQQYDKFGFKLPDLPENFGDLVTVINIINILIDKNIYKQFLESSCNILNEKMEITKDDFQNSNTYFDTIADQQLIKLMNEHLEDDSFDEFISNLPTETIPNPIFYKKYPSLLNIPYKCIQTRATFFYQFNILTEKIISTLDLSLLPGQSILVDYIRRVKNYLLQKNKFEWFEESLSKTEIGTATKLLAVEFDTMKASVNSNDGENTMFNQAFKQLHEDAHIIFRLKNERLWWAKYVGMHSIDQGGPYRDSITAICSDICSTRLPLFILCPNGQANNGSNGDCWIPNVFPANKPISNRIKKQYQFIGQLMGMAIRKKNYLNIKFPALLWKQLIGEEITMADIEAIDIQSFAILKEMENTIEKNQLINTDSDINDLYSSILSELRFDVISSSGQTYELIPGGQDIPVTVDNLKEYCIRYREYRLNEFHQQIEYIRQGLRNVIPIDFLTLFTANELEEAVCGKDTIDVSFLKRNTVYRGNYNEDSPHIQRFWTVLNDMFDEAQKKLFLIFVWGRSTLPMKDEDFSSKFIIDTIFPKDDQQADEMLPRAHTCFFALHLPEYSTTDIMYERLNYAITNCLDTDADGINDNVNNTTDQNNNAGDGNEQLSSVLATLFGRNFLTS